MDGVTQDTLTQNPDLIKNVKSLLASRFSGVNDNNVQEIDRFVEDNEHLRYLTDIAHIQ